MTDKQKLGKFAIFLFLLCTLFARLLMPDEKSVWIEIINYSGVCVALADLYVIVHSKKDKFSLIRGIAVLVVIVMIIFAALIVTGMWVLTPKANDCLTILALLLSLPSDLYASVIKKYIES